MQGEGAKRQRKARPAPPAELTISAVRDDPADWADDGQPLQAAPNRPDVPMSLQLASQIAVGHPPGKDGQPTKLTRSTARIIVTAVREGNYPHIAAQLAGIAKRTYDEWMERAEREPDSRYAQLALAVAQAESEAEAIAIGRILAAGDKDWKATSTWLGRRHRDRWAEQTIDHGSGAKVQVNIGIALPAPGSVAPQVLTSQRVSVMPDLIE